MTWLLDNPFVLFETPLWFQLAVALPYWGVFFSVKGIMRWRTHRRSKRWLDFIGSHPSRHARDKVWLARFQPDVLSPFEREFYRYPGA